MVVSHMSATRSRLHSDLVHLGVRQGDMLTVHASIRAMGQVTGGGNVIVQALLDAIGPAGTLVAYIDFEPFFDEADELEVPVFDKRIAHTARDHGILHEVMRTWPGAVRSDHPDAGVVAIGACGLDHRCPSLSTRLWRRVMSARRCLSCLKARTWCSSLSSGSSGNAFPRLKENS